MRWVYVSVVAAGLTAPAQIQTPPPALAPPEVEAALRARITHFYQAHVDGKFRVADQDVAEESKEVFFAAQKRQFKGFSISSITYSDNFTKAQATVAVQTEWHFHGQITPVTIPLRTHWKVVDGQWFWYDDPVKEENSPYGTMKPTAQKDPSVRVIIPPDPNKAAKDLLSKINVDRKEVHLTTAQASSDEVTLFNGLQGPIQVEVSVPSTPGLKVEAAEAMVMGGAKTAIRFHYEPVADMPKPVKPIPVRVLISPTRQVFQVKVTFSASAPQAEPPKPL